jgi:hypothetical protein
MTQKNEPFRPKNSAKDYFAIAEVFGYFFRKNDPNRPSNFNIRTMHTINKISILMFVIGVVLFVIKVVLR